MFHSSLGAIRKFDYGNQIGVSHQFMPSLFNLPLYFGHIYINFATVCPLPHTDPQHRPESPRSGYLTPIHNTGPSPLDPATWPLPEHYLAGLRPAALPASTTSQLCPDVAPEKVVTRRPGEGRRPPPRRRPADPATRPPPKHVPGHSQDLPAGE
jgi:hypothetical protein